VSVFRRRRRDGSPQEADEVVEAEEGLEEGSDVPATLPPAGPRTPSGKPVAAGREDGPWDISEVVNPAAGGRVDLGGMWLPGRPGLEVRIEADQATSQVVAVTLVLGEGALQVQPFAAPRTETIWDEIRDEIRAGITKQGGTADEVEGPLGTELRTRVPVRAQDGSSSVQPARFVGVDGPRWFLRGVLTGRAAVEEGADAELVELFRDIVVVRGEGPMAPRDPIPLSLPATPGSSKSEKPADDDQQQARSQEDLKPFERGPEITEIR
jgi:hypothetical protein